MQGAPSKFPVGTGKQPIQIKSEPDRNEKGPPRLCGHIRPIVRYLPISNTKRAMPAYLPGSTRESQTGSVVYAKRGPFPFQPASPIAAFSATLSA